MKFNMIGLGLLFCMTVVAVAEQAENDQLSSDTAVYNATPEELPEYTKQEIAEMEAPFINYNRCIRLAILGALESKVTREEVIAGCTRERSEVTLALPEFLQEYTLLNMDRRLDTVLDVLFEADSLVDETVSDSIEAAEILKAD